MGCNWSCFAFFSRSAIRIIPASIRNMPPTSSAYPNDTQSRKATSPGLDWSTKKRYGSRTARNRSNRLSPRARLVSSGIIAIIRAYPSQIEIMTKKLNANNPRFTASSEASVGVLARSSSEPIERASPNTRSDSDSTRILIRGIPETSGLFSSGKIA